MKHYTSVVDHEGKPFVISEAEKIVTTNPLTPFLKNFIFRHKTFGAFAKRCAQFSGRTANPLNVYSDRDLLLQRLLGIFAGMTDLNDSERLRNDPIFEKTLGNIASAATLSRYESLIGNKCRFLNEWRHGPSQGFVKYAPERVGSEFFEELNEVLLEGALAHIMQKMGPRPKRLILDADSTYIATFGEQEESAYDGDNRGKGYFPCMLFLEGLPVYIQNAPGSTDGRRLLEQFIEGVLVRITEIFPHTKILVRADTGFNSDRLVRILCKYRARFLIGFAQNTTLLPQAIKEIGKKLFDRESVSEFTKNLPKTLLEVLFDGAWGPLQTGIDETCVKRWCGKVEDYQAKTWSSRREVYYRINYSPAHDHVDFRFIITNIPSEEVEFWCAQLGVRKNFTEVLNSFDSPAEAERAINLYDGLYCNRAHCELLIKEFKGLEITAKMSAQSFFSNWFRLMLGALAMHVFTELREKALGIWHQWQYRSFHTMLRDLFHIPGIIREYARHIELQLMPRSEDTQKAFLKLVRACD